MSETAAGQTGLGTTLAAQLAGIYQCKVCAELTSSGSYGFVDPHKRLLDTPSLCMAPHLRLFVAPEACCTLHVPPPASSEQTLQAVKPLWHTPVQSTAESDLSSAVVE